MREAVVSEMTQVKKSDCWLENSNRLRQAAARAGQGEGSESNQFESRKLHLSAADRHR